MLELVVDNTPIIKADEQPFQYPIFVSRDEMKELRGGFDDWMDNQCPLCEKGVPVTKTRYINLDQLARRLYHENLI